jgi:hypothetical protein
VIFRLGRYPGATPFSNRETPSPETPPQSSKGASEDPVSSQFSVALPIRGAFVIVQEPSQTRSSMHATVGTDGRCGHDQQILQALMIPFAMIVLDELAQGTAEMALTYRNQPVDAFFFDRSDKALRMRIGVRRSYGRVVFLDSANTLRPARRS